MMSAGILNTELNMCRATLCRNLGNKTSNSSLQRQHDTQTEAPSPLREPMSAMVAIRKYLSFVTKIKLRSFGSSSEETLPQTNEVQ